MDICDIGIIEFVNAYRFYIKLVIYFQVFKYKCLSWLVFASQHELRLWPIYPLNSIYFILCF